MLTANVPCFPGFNPVDTTELLRASSNIPLIAKEAHAASMKSTFWTQELNDMNQDGQQIHLQAVTLDFFMPRFGDMLGPIRWPHISINTVSKVA